MKRKPPSFSRRYPAALRRFLRAGLHANLGPARRLGSEAQAAGLHTLDLAKLHEQTLVTEMLRTLPADRRAAILTQAGTFFAVAINPIEKTHRTAREATVHLNRFIESLSRRTVELAASNFQLSLEITRRKGVEAALKKSERHYSLLLKRSDQLQEQLRRLSRQILSAQEEERKEISRELHDVIAQTLTGINIRLTNLKREAIINTKGFDRKIANAQRLVEKSVQIVHQFARELRPAVLDDLGLIPALHSYMKGFTTRTGVRTNLISFAGVELLDATRRTVLFRVAQEALTNVSRHAKASRADVSITRKPGRICMEISDDGKSFSVERALHASVGKRLGLLGMRERLEMVDGQFAVKSTPGQGTTVIAQIPFGRRRTSRKRPAPAERAPEKLAEKH